MSRWWAQISLNKKKLTCGGGAGLLWKMDDVDADAAGVGCGWCWMQMELDADELKEKEKKRKKKVLTSCGASAGLQHGWMRGGCGCDGGE